MLKQIKLGYMFMLCLYMYVGTFTPLVFVPLCKCMSGMHVQYVYMYTITVS